MRIEDEIDEMKEKHKDTPKINPLAVFGLVLLGVILGITVIRML
jgi:hypothetical protein